MQRAQFPKAACIVITRCIYNGYGAERQKLHALLYGVGSSALNIADKGHFLVGYPVYKAAFPGISKTEESDMSAFGRRCIVKTHVIDVLLYWHLNSYKSVRFMLKPEVSFSGSYLNKAFSYYLVH